MDTRNVDTVLIRMDKIGDLVVTMPVDEHPVFAGQKTHWFITKGLGFVPERAVPQRAYTEFKRGFSISGFMHMVNWFKTNNPRTVVLLHNPWWVTCAAWWAGVPERIGRRSQWHGFLWVNLPVKQKRSASDRHESDFNFDFVEWGFNRLGLRATENLLAEKKRFLRLAPPSPVATLSARGLKSGEYRVVHPGMGGSALNWPTESFIELVEKLSSDSLVVITGTKADRKYLEPLKSLEGNARVRWLAEQLSLSELLDVLSGARSVVGPSTGVLHLGAALGRPAVGIYSPRKVEHPRRWGPKGANVRTLVPDAPEGVPLTSEVMRGISVAQVVAAVKEVENARTSAQTHADV